MNESSTSTRPARAARSSDSTRSAPRSLLRKARIADVSSTNRVLLAIPPGIPAALGEQAAHRARLARAPEGGDGVVRDRDHARGVALQNPFEGCPRRDAELAPDLGRNRHLSTIRHLGTHATWSIM